MVGITFSIGQGGLPFGSGGYLDRTGTDICSMQAERKWGPSCGSRRLKQASCQASEPAAPPGQPVDCSRRGGGGCGNNAATVETKWHQFRRLPAYKPILPLQQSRARSAAVPPVAGAEWPQTCFSVRLRLPQASSHHRYCSRICFSSSGLKSFSKSKSARICSGVLSLIMLATPALAKSTRSAACK